MQKNSLLSGEKMYSEAALRNLLPGWNVNHLVHLTKRYII